MVPLRHGRRLEAARGDHRARRHFIVPFFLISRKTKRNTVALGLMSGFLLVMQVLDMVFIIRPMVYIGEPAEYDPARCWWLDVAAVARGCGPVRRPAPAQQVASGPLVPIKILGSAALAHKNYV